MYRSIVRDLAPLTCMSARTNNNQEITETYEHVQARGGRENMSTKIVLTFGKISNQGGESEKEEEEILWIAQLYGLIEGQVITSTSSFVSSSVVHYQVRLKCLQIASLRPTFQKSCLDEASLKTNNTFHRVLRLLFRSDRSSERWITFAKLLDCILCYVRYSASRDLINFLFRSSLFILTDMQLSHLVDVVF